MARESLTREEIERDFGRHHYLVAFGFGTKGDIHDRWLNEAYDLVGEKRYNQLCEKSERDGVRKWN